MNSLPYTLNQILDDAVSRFNVLSLIVLRTVCLSSEQMLVTSRRTFHSGDGPFGYHQSVLSGSLVKLDNTENLKSHLNEEVIDHYS